MSDRRKRRFWSDAEKLEICNQARVPGVSVAQVARRYALNANMLHAWLRDPRFAGGDEGPVDVPGVGADKAPGSSFYEVSISSAPSPRSSQASIVGGGGPFPQLAGGVAPQGSIHASRVDLSLSDGRRVLIEGAMSLAAIVALIEGLVEGLAE